VLQDALSKEPNNFVTLTLLGDLQVRDGEFDDAAAYYKKASDLNPRDTGLAQLAEQTAATAAPEAVATKKKQPTSG
jgi:cytochrome c-type biogenesis protein CcmH/NrfG